VRPLPGQIRAGKQNGCAPGLQQRTEKLAPSTFESLEVVGHRLVPVWDYES
jgi:hypothetical protein